MRQRTISHAARVLVGSTVVAALLISAGGCALRPEVVAKDGSWTVLTYEIADTDLEPYMMVDVEEMGAVGSQEALNLISFVDRASDYSDDDVLGLANWNGAKILRVEQDGATVLDDLGDVNTGDPAVLADFITDGFADNPADHYALIISDHGASWPGVGGDESSDQDSLSLAELDQAISEGLAGAEVPKLDLLGFDACLMATWEVASTLAPLADRMLASQELEPGHGWDYTALQGAAEGASVDELGSALIDGFAAQAQDEGDDSEITLSLIDLTQLPAVDDALAEFGTILVDSASRAAPVVGRTLASTLGFGSSPDPDQDSFMTDLGILAAEIGVDALYASDAADALVRAINDAVIDKVDGQATKGATGLSIYFPPTAEYFSSDYTDLAGAQTWVDFLAAYYGAGAGIPESAKPQFTSTDAEVFFDDDGLNITGTFDLAAQDNLAAAEIRYGIVESDGTVTFLGEEPAAIADDGSGLALGIYDLTSLTISDGEDTANAYLQLAEDSTSGLFTIDVPMSYYEPGSDIGQNVLLSLTIDGDSGDVVSEVHYSYDVALGTYGELTAEPDGIIVPELPNETADGTREWMATTDVGLYADLPNLVYDLSDLPSGTRLYIELSVTDFGGNFDTVSAFVDVP